MSCFTILINGTHLHSSLNVFHCSASTWFNVNLKGQEECKTEFKWQVWQKSYPLLSFFVSCFGELWLEICTKLKISVIGSNYFQRCGIDPKRKYMYDKLWYSCPNCTCKFFKYMVYSIFQFCKRRRILMFCNRTGIQHSKV